MLIGLGVPVPMGMQEEPHETQDKDREYQVDDGRDQRSHPLGPAEQVAGLSAFEVQIHLLENVFGLKGDNSGGLFQFLHGLKKLWGRDVAEHSLSIPIPIKDLSLGYFGSDGILAVDLVILQLQVAAALNVDSGAFRELDGLGDGRAAFLGGDDLFVGVDQVVDVPDTKDSFISGLNLEVAVPGCGFRVFDV